MRTSDEHGWKLPNCNLKVPPPFFLREVRLERHAENRLIGDFSPNPATLMPYKQTKVVRTQSGYTRDTIITYK